MLEILSKGFKNAKAVLTGNAVLTEENIDTALREIRVSLLEADVEVGVVRTFLDRVKTRAIGEVVPLSVKKEGKKYAATPGDHFALICHHELEKLMGPVEEKPIAFRRPYTIIMLVGLQGTGKTTTAGKLAATLKADHRRPLLVAADIYRPAAIDQLKSLGVTLGVPVFAQKDLDPAHLCADALREAKQKKRDVVIFDTAGRLAIDDTLMIELEQIKSRTKPDHILLVADAMAGQDTVRTAAEFNRRLDLTGFILTKMDGDARGGAALSIKEITGKPIKFLGTGEGLEKLEAFRPEGLASRILGMGDVMGLMKDFETIVDEKEAERDTKKLLRGQFTLEDFLKQLRLLKQLGSVSEIYEKFPVFGSAGAGGVAVDDKMFVVLESLIQSMTQKERANPQLIDQSRAARIARGSGRKPNQVADLLGRFQMMNNMVANIAAQPGLLGMLPGFKELAAVRQSKGQDVNALFGNVPGGMRAMAKGRMGPGPGGMMPAGPMAGLPGLPGLPGMGSMTNLMANAPVDGARGQLPPGPGGFALPPAARQRSSRDRDKARLKRKAERKARKKSRR